ncbi:hypothetical protein L7F22_025268 [Adiantum nelumboides]|nr:hypothetical protein [Adiantum nelumboides]
MAGREVREYTNLSDPKDKKWGGKGVKDKVDDEDVAFKRMVAKMQEVAGERGGYLHGRGALDSDDLLYLKEQMEAEEDAERLRRRTEKRAFAAFRKAASLADASASSASLPLRVESKPRSAIRQQILLRNIKPKCKEVSRPSSETGGQKSYSSGSDDNSVRRHKGEATSKEAPKETTQNRSGSLLGLAYESSDEE